MTSRLVPLASNDLLCASDVFSDFQSGKQFMLKVYQFIGRAEENVNAFLFTVEIN